MTLTNTGLVFVSGSSSMMEASHPQAVSPRIEHECTYDECTYDECTDGCHGVFRRSAGQWQSQRTTHHLPFRRAESGSSSIRVKALEVDDPQIIEICKMHDFEPAQAIGGAHVTWSGSMDWDKEDEDHEGSTVFALVPDADNPRAGSLLRERGYAEITPVVGRYLLDDEDGLVLTTDYETMSSTERFWFMGPNLRLRSSTVKRFGGLSTSSFCAETRLEPEATTPEPGKTWEETALYSSLGW